MRPLLEVSDQVAEICLLLWLKTFPPGANVDNSGTRSFRVLSACWTFRRSQDQKGNRRGSGGCGLFKHPPKLMAHEDARPGRSRLAPPFTWRGSGHSSRLQQEPSSSRGTGWQSPQPWPVNHRWWQPAVAGLWSHGAGRRLCPALSPSLRAGQRQKPVPWVLHLMCEIRQVRAYAGSCAEHESTVWCSCKEGVLGCIYRTVIAKVWEAIMPCY